MLPSSPSSSESSKGFKQTLGSTFKSSAAETRTRILAEKVNKAEQGESSIYSNPKMSNESNKDKAKRLVAQRDASSPTSNFVLS